jgi:hypothetical protein
LRQKELRRPLLSGRARGKIVTKAVQYRLFYLPLRRYYASSGACCNGPQGQSGAGN